MKKNAANAPTTITTITTAIIPYVTLLLMGVEDCVGVEDGLEVGLGEADEAGVGEGVGDLVGVGVTIGVGVGAFTKLAVIVPGPFIVAVAEASPALSNVMLFVLEDHEENV
jgi:hypothetical protein